MANAYAPQPSLGRHQRAAAEATADVFESWLTAIAVRFETAGISSERARELAIEAVAALEGAFILSRAMRTTVPVEIAGRATVASVRAALPRAKGRAAK